MGPVTDDERNGLINHSALYGKYEEEVDRESALKCCKGVQITPNSSSPPVKGQQSGDDDGHFRRPERYFVRHDRPARRQARWSGTNGREKRGSR
jgi:hypothetical protein